MALLAESVEDEVEDEDEELAERARVRVRRRRCVAAVSVAVPSPAAAVLSAGSSADTSTSEAAFARVFLVEVGLDSLSSLIVSATSPLSALTARRVREREDRFSLLSPERTESKSESAEAVADVAGENSGA